MDEGKMKRQMIRVTAILVACGVLLCAIVFGIMQYVLRTAHEADHEQMQLEVQEYKSRILKQMDKNLQILTTLAEAYKVSEITQTEEKLEESIIETNKANPFISLAFFWPDGHGILNALGEDTLHAMSLDACDENAAQAVRQALQGEVAVSRMFRGSIYDGSQFLYVVPVYQNDEVVGALSAGDTLEVFEDIVNGNAVLGGEGYLHLLGSDGAFLVRSERTLIKDEMQTIFDGAYLSEETKQAARTALAQQQSMFGDFTYQGESCHFYMEPLGLNGWYLFCANRLWGSSMSYGRILVIVAAAFLFLLLMMLALMAAAYYKFRKNTAMLLQLAYFDPVTGAKNTTRFDSECIELQKKEAAYSIAVLDVHNFKWVNDLFGPTGGDNLLRYLALQIGKILHEDEIFCRDAADQFYLWLHETDMGKIRERLGKLIDSVREVTSRATYSYEITLYAGVAVQGDRDKALVALQSIRNKQYQSIAFYDAELHKALRERNQIESSMQSALQNREFRLFLQSKHDLRNDRLAGAEALVRWYRPDGSCCYPNVFIPLFEENGFCVKLDLYMVERVCEQLRAWIDAGIEPIPISVNQSKLLFADRNYPTNLEQIVDRYQVPRELITLEILEGVAMEDFGLLEEQIEALHARGFRVSMDDFGTGYSSLTMLSRLRVDEVKLDRGFLHSAPGEEEARRQIILEQVVSAAHRLKIAVVAEGIETELDRDTVAALGCELGQGYFYDRPISAENFTACHMQNKTKEEKEE